MATEIETVIAHVSDLHYVDNLEWKSTFDDLKNSLCAQGPDVMIISGDLADTPSKHSYRELSIHLQGLVDIIADKYNKQIYIISIPGNHDYFTYGWLPIKSKTFNYAKNSLSFPHSLSVTDICVSIYNEFSIAIFPFDSNDVFLNDWFNFAQGRINSVDKCFNDHITLYQNYEKCLLKIAVLHHHPLPMAISYNEEYKEPFLVLKKSHQFLSACMSNNVDAILHGHMHTVGSCEYRMLLPDSYRKPLRIFGCGSSGKMDCPSREYVIHRLNRTGHVHSEIYRADIRHPRFSYQEIPSLLPYNDVRKMKTQSNTHYEHNSMVDNCLQKTKIVQISSNGDATVDIFLEGLSWKGDTGCHTEFVIKENVTADVGRIPWYGAYLGTELPLLDGTMSLFSKTEMEKYYGTVPEDVTLDVRKQSCDLGSKYFGHFQYLMFGGYCLSQNEHINLYPDLPNEVRREFCYGHVDYRTDVLEINVKFPDRISFPAPGSFHLVAVKRGSINYAKDGFCYLNQAYDECTTETDFLKKKKALSVRPSTLEVTARIRYPQPN